MISHEAPIPHVPRDHYSLNLLRVLEDFEYHCVARPPFQWPISHEADACKGFSSAPHRTRLAESKNDSDRQGKSRQRDSNCLIDVSGLSRFHFCASLLCFCDSQQHLSKSQTDLILRWIHGKSIFGLRVQLFDEIGRGWILCNPTPDQNAPQPRRIEYRHRFPSLWSHQHSQHTRSMWGTLTVFSSATSRFLGLSTPKVPREHHSPNQVGSMRRVGRRQARHCCRATYPNPRMIPTANAIPASTIPTD